MKAIFALIAALFIVPAQALLLEARLVSFEFTDATINGQNTMAGVGEFEIIQGNTLRFGLEFLCANDTFKALTLEPMQSVTIGNSYWFNFVDVDRPGPFLLGKYDTFLGIAQVLQWRRVEDIETQLEVSTAQIAAWEAVQEPLDNPFNVFGDEVVLSGEGDTLVQFLSETDLPDDLIGYRMLNLGESDFFSYVPIPSMDHSDFIVFRHPDDPLPAGCP